MQKKLVYHHNMIGHEINESLEYYVDDVFDREIYCRKLHQIKEPLKEDCTGCPCFEGWEQGHGIECAWEDVAETEYVVQHEDRYKEYERVDKLVKLGVIENVADSLIAKVKEKPYDEAIWIYEQSQDRNNRFLLGKRGNKTLLCCGVNPSFASPENLDPTMKNVEAFAEAHGYDSYVMINLYPMRATNPSDMHKEKDENIVRENLKYIEKVLAAGNCDIWAAWGNLIKTRKYLKECLQSIASIAEAYECKWYTIGTKTKEGHPHHPLYLNRKWRMEEFDIHTYLQNIK